MISRYVCLIVSMSVCTFVCLSVSLFVWQFDCPSLCLFVRLPAYVFFSVSKGTSIGSLSVCLCLSVKSILYDFLIARLSCYRSVCVAVSFSTMSVCLTAIVFVCLSLCLSAILIIHQIIGFPQKRVRISRVASAQSQVAKRHQGEIGGKDFREIRSS